MTVPKVLAREAPPDLDVERGTDNTPMFYCDGDGIGSSDASLHSPAQHTRAIDSLVTFIVLFLKL